MARMPSPWIALYGLLVVLVPLLAVTAQPSPSAVERHENETHEQLRGVWSRYEGRGTGEAVRFYYFHGDGKGLYRYGRIGFNNTNSFDYEVREDRPGAGTLVVHFRKTGERHAVPFRIEPDANTTGRQWLMLDADPREAGATRYFRDPDPASAAVEPLGSSAHRDARSPAGHMWLDVQRFATGGMAFHFYQLRDVGTDGRGVGWFHRGDFDDWSTEALDYRVVGDRLELHFPIRREHAVTSFRMSRAGDRRLLVIEDDPRDFWHEHAYVDGGPSFGWATGDRGLGLNRVAGSALMGGAR